MPQIIVTADGPAVDGKPPIMFRERVSVSDFESQHFTAQLAERLGWAVGDADELERRSARTTERRRVHLAVETEAAEDEAAEPELAEAEAGQPELAEAQAAEPELAEAEAGQPELAEAQAAEPELAEDEAAELAEGEAEFAGVSGGPARPAS